MNLNLGTQYYAGYADVICVLNSGDTMYGIRYRQDNWAKGESHAYAKHNYQYFSVIQYCIAEHAMGFYLYTQND